MSTEMKVDVSDEPWVLDLARCEDQSVERVGGKAHGLGRLMGWALPVPGGFVVTTDAYRRCVADLAPRIEDILTRGAGDLGSQESAADEVRSLFETSVLVPEVTAGITRAYLTLAPGDDLPVAIRSSATAEDTDDASFAGQQDSYLWIRGVKQVIEHVVQCWASLYTSRAVAYRERRAEPSGDGAMAVVVQHMVPAAAAGVMMTLEPVSGDRSTIYLESAHGLGEIVVRGEVEPDRFSVAKQDMAITRSDLGVKDSQYLFDADAGEVRLLSVSEPLRSAPSITAEEVVVLAGLGRRVEELADAPMDLEWAVADDESRTVQLLQARPETVWSRGRPTPAEPAGRDSWDTLMSASAKTDHWSTTNISEAVPGVQTTLSWSIWGPGIEAAMKEAAFALGVLRSSERPVRANQDERWVRPFYGRAVIDVGFLATVGDRMPGTSGPDAVRSILGRVPQGYPFRPTRTHYPTVALRLPRTFATVPGRMRKTRANHAAWWADRVRLVASMDADEARASLLDGARHHHNAVITQTVGVVSVIQPVYDLVTKLVAQAGTGDLSALTGVSGGAEMAIVNDLWDASRGRVSLDDVVRRHGFHGPAEGELSSIVWREDATPLRAVVEQYASRGDEHDPREAEQARCAQRPVLEREVIEAFPRWQRPAVRGVLSLARSVLPLRGATKRSFLQGLDIARASARRLGEHLVLDGVLDDPEDVFHLTLDELTSSDGRLPRDARELVQRRRARREEYVGLALPDHWVGVPVPVPTRIRPEGPEAGAGTRIEGVGVSSGVVEGIARVLLTPDFTSARSDESLVAPTTDPSWASIMFVSSALVVDVGGALSHAAVVARELGVPCVVNTREGTAIIRTGDRLRVDGTTGTVEVLPPA